MSNLHKSWIETAVTEGLAAYEDAEITVKNVPNKGDEKKIPFQKVVFTASDPAEITKLFNLAEAGKGTIKDDAGNDVPAENPLNVLLTYAYGLNCRAKVRADFERQFEDPDKALKKAAEALVKGGAFKSFDKALAAVKAMREEDDEDEDA